MISKLCAASLAALVLSTISASSLFVVENGQRAVVTRFGSYSYTAYPGVNVKLPLIDQVTFVQIRDQGKPIYCIEASKSDYRCFLNET